MATALDMITRGLRLISVLGTGRRTPSANESADGLVTLNSMMKTLSLKRGLIHYMLEETHVLTANVGSYTIGSGGAIDTDAPVRIENAFIRDTNNYDYPLEIINNLAYDTVTLKTITSRPQYLYYERSFPLGTIYLLYLPNLPETLHINSWKQLQTFASLTTALSMPLGYEDMIVFNLAVRMHGEYPGSVLSDEVRQLAKETLADVIRINAEPPVLDPGDSIMDLHGHGQRNIFSG